MHGFNNANNAWGPCLECGRRLEGHDDPEWHCGRCGAAVAEVQFVDPARRRWFHTLGFRPVYPDPDGMEWRIGHDADPLPGPPTDRRTAAVKPLPVKPLPEPVYIDDDGFVIEPVDYTDQNREGDPAFNGAFDRW